MSLQSQPLNSQYRLGTGRARALTCARGANKMHVKHAACCNPVIKEQRLCVSQEVNSACNVTHATLLLGLHQLAQYCQNPLSALNADPAKGLALHCKNIQETQKQGRH